MRNNYVTIIYLILLPVLFLHTGCSKSELPQTSPALFFEVEYPGQQPTKVSDRGFESNDVIGVYVTGHKLPLQLGGNVLNNARMINKGEQWFPETPQKWDSGAYDVYAYYPYIEHPATVQEIPFSLATDQSKAGNGETLGGYESSDFLWATTEAVSASTSPVKLRFSHRLSRLVVNLVKGEDYDGELNDSEISVYIHNTVADGFLDLTSGYVMKDSYCAARTLKAKPVGNHSFAAVIIPQRIDYTVPLVEIEMNGVSYMVSTQFAFKFGMQHTINVAMSKNPEQIKISVGGEIVDWN